MKLFTPQECMGIWLSQKPVRNGKTLWYSIAKCIECAVNQDETARELSRIRTDIAKHDEKILKAVYDSGWHCEIHDFEALKEMVRAELMKGGAE